MAGMLRRVPVDCVTLRSGDRRRQKWRSLDQGLLDLVADYWTIMLINSPPLCLVRASSSSPS